MRFRLLIVLIMCSYAAVGQENNDLKEWIEHNVGENTDDIDVLDLSEQLERLMKFKINLNTKPESLIQLFFVTRIQVDNLKAHLQRNGPLIDILELQSINGFDQRTVTRLLPFVTVSDPNSLKRFSFRNCIENGENQLLIRYGRVLEKQKGYVGTSGNRYTGSPDKMLLTYRYRLQDRLSLSLVGEKDAGERFPASMRAFDFTSGNVTLTGARFLKKIVVGDYSLQFGQGLTLWSGFSFGKTPEVAGITKNAIGLKPYASANEYSFFRGLAATFRLSGKLELTPFYSDRRMDATVENNTGEREMFTTVHENGLHRTASELASKRSLQKQTTGGSLQFTNHRIVLGVTLYRSKFDKPASIGKKVYQQFDFTGQHLTNAGINYSYTIKNFHFFGETAFSLPGSEASINGLLVSLSPTLSAAVLHRSYSNSFHNFHSAAISENTEVSNEKALFYGVQFIPNKRWSVSLYTDIAAFRWLKYRVDAPSQSLDKFGTLQFTPSKYFGIVVSLRSKSKQQNANLATNIDVLEWITKEDLKLNIKWQANGLHFQNGFAFAKYVKGDLRPEYGTLFFQDILTQSDNSSISANLRFAFFKTSSYNTRLFAYERDVLYSYTSGHYSGTGVKLYANFRYRIVRPLTSWFRYVINYYPKNNSVGSGLEESHGNKRQEIKIQLRYQF